MNNIRKIITERLENAREEHYYLQRNSDGSDDYKLSEIIGQMEAYLDCLNLIPAPRTEQDILNDFEKLGWEVVKNDEFNLIMNNSNVFILDITKASLVGAYTCYDTTKEQSALYIPIQEHKLLSELFTIWGWL